MVIYEAVGLAVVIVLLLVGAITVMNFMERKKKGARK